MKKIGYLFTNLYSDDLTSSLPELRDGAVDRTPQTSIYKSIDCLMSDEELHTALRSNSMHSQTDERESKAREERLSRQVMNHMHTSGNHDIGKQAASV